MKKIIYLIGLILLCSVSCKKDDPEPEAKRQIIYDTTKVIDRHVDSIYHHFYDSIYHHFYDTVKVINRYTDSIFHHFYDSVYHHYTDSIFHHYYDSIYHHFYDTITVYDTVRVPIISDHSWIIYIHNDGTEDVDTVEIKNGTYTELKSDLTRYGYNLVKWSTSSTGGIDYVPGDSYYVDKDITLYAIWQSLDGLRSNELYDFLSKQEDGSTVDVKIVDLSPDFYEIKRALDKFWKVNVNLDLGETINVDTYPVVLNGCRNVISIILPPNLRYLDIALDELTSLVVPFGVETLRVSGNKLESIEIPNSVTELCIQNAGLKSISIPNSVTKITKIVNCPSLTEITIPESVESMDLNFRECTNLTTVKHSLKDCSGIDFYGCKNLTAIKIPELRPEARDFYGFGYCSSLTSITIPEGAISIMELAFQNCSSLTEVTIPASVTSIGGFAFQWCSSLTSITIPKGVTSIGASAFQYCTSLTDVTIPASVTSIGNSAFQYCSSLTDVIIPASVTSIGTSVFRNCTSLSSLYIGNTTPPSLLNGWIEYYGTIYVPSSAVNAYKTAEGWKTYAAYIIGY